MAFAAVTVVMPLDMPESVLVRFKGQMQPGITLRDLVNAIPLYAIKAGLLTVEKKGKKNVFSGRILEIEGLPNLKPLNTPTPPPSVPPCAALAGRIVSKEEYMEQIKLVNAKAGEVYRYMNFDQIPEFVEQAATVEM